MREFRVSNLLEIRRHQCRRCCNAWCGSGRLSILMKWHLDIIPPLVYRGVCRLRAFSRTFTKLTVSSFVCNVTAFFVFGTQLPTCFHSAVGRTKDDFTFTIQQWAGIRRHLCLHDKKIEKYCNFVFVHCRRYYLNHTTCNVRFFLVKAGSLAQTFRATKSKMQYDPVYKSNRMCHT